MKVQIHSVYKLVVDEITNSMRQKNDQTVIGSRIRDQFYVEK